MLRIFGAAVRGYAKSFYNPTFTNIANLAKATCNKPSFYPWNIDGQSFHHICRTQSNTYTAFPLKLGNYFENGFINNAVSGFQVPSRSVTKFSLRKGKRKSVKTILRRFYRLNWGIWIRTRAGRFKRQWKKKENRRKRQRQHVFTNATQSYMLDKMVTKFWRRPKYYVDDPYASYHTREEFYITRRKPLP